MEAIALGKLRARSEAVSGLLRIRSDDIDVTPALAGAPVAARRPKVRRMT